MAVTRVFTIEGSSVSAGSSDTLTDSDNDDWVIEKIQIVDESGNLGSVSDATIRIAGNSLTDQVVPLDALTGSIDTLPKWNAVWQSNKQFQFDYNNEAGSALTLDVVLWVREATESETGMDPGARVSE